ncbi:tetratricopeptide repeat protein [Vicingaceae bacterium]|nr:tetratricopeptide repeat protein [Vicingaceae bacterium]
MNKFLLIFFYLFIFCDTKSEIIDLDKLNYRLKSSTTRNDSIETLNKLGSYYESISNYTKSLEYLYQAQTLNASEKILKESIINNNYIGYVYWHKSEYDSSLHYHNKALELAEGESLNDENLSFTYLMLGNDYYDKGNFNQASIFYYKSLKVAERIGSNDMLIQINNRLSKLYFKMKDYTLAVSSALKSLELNQSKNIRELGVSYNTLGNLSLIKNEHDSALYYFNKTLVSFQKCGDVIGQSIASINLGDTYLALFHRKNNRSLLDSSYNYYEKSHYLNSNVDNKFGMIYGLWGMADVNVEKENTQEALLNYQKALNVSVDIGAKSEELNLYKKLHLLYDDSKKPDSSLLYLKRHVLLKNKVESTEQSKQLLRQESIYEAEKIIEKEKTASERKLFIENEKNKWKNIFIGLIIFVALILLYISYISLKRLKTIRSKNKIINHINNELNTQKQEITDSINYASRIQNAILPSGDFLKECLPNSFLLYKPKDIVAGDFYWMEKIVDKVIFAVADCTGHGVPGAMMSVICSNALSKAVKEYNIYSPEEILNKVNDIVKDALHNKADEVRDGMDISLCVWDKSTNKLLFSGAFNSFYYCRNNELNILKADRMPIGKYIHNDKLFSLHEVQLQKGDMIYLYTDGYADQFGGEQGRKFKTKSFRELLLKVHLKDVENQLTILDETIENWKGEIEQIDDICVLGIKV